MEAAKLVKGTKVTFRGHAVEGHMVSAIEGGPDVFEATVDIELFGMNTYALTWPNGDPVGIPFTRASLTVVS